MFVQDREGYRHLLFSLLFQHKTKIQDILSKSNRFILLQMFISVLCALMGMWKTFKIQSLIEYI